MQGEIVGVELRAEGELAGRFEVEEGDPREIYEGPLAEARRPFNVSCRLVREKRSNSPIARPARSAQTPAVLCRRRSRLPVALSGSRHM